MSEPTVTVVDHPLVKHKLTLMRRKETSTASFRALCTEISMLLAYEATRDMKLTEQEIETPLATIQSPILEGKKVVLIGVLRAGLGILDGQPQPGIGAGVAAADPRGHGNGLGALAPDLAPLAIQQGLLVLDIGCVRMASHGSLRQWLCDMLGGMTNDEARMANQVRMTE